jgi:hypothetical protein
MKDQPECEVQLVNKQFSDIEEVTSEHTQILQANQQTLVA